MGHQHLTVAEYLRLFALRGPQIMWLFGAGTSASTGIPTAGHMVWEFKRSIFCTEQRLPLASVQDLSDPATRARIQNHLNSGRNHPVAESPEEYSHFFEFAYKSEADRRRYLDDHVARARPTPAHQILATLASLSRIDVMWTTNFDRLIEDAHADVFGTTTTLRTATPADSSIAESAVNEGGFPLLIKLHGDYHSSRLKNTRAELQEQDQKLRKLLVRTCNDRGLAVVGYSGRDDSVIDALEQAASGETPFPSGLYWFHRADSPPTERVLALLSRARGAGVEASTIEIETFDELMLDIARHTPNFPDRRLEARSASCPFHFRRIAAPTPCFG